MKLIIAGGRAYQLSLNDFIDLGFCFDGVATEVVSGGAEGVDMCGEAWAKAQGLRVQRFSPDWNLHGKAAGPIRNRMMAAYADAAVIFPGGKGTENMMQEARLACLEIWDWRIPGIRQLAGREVER